MKQTKKLFRTKKLVVTFFNIACLSIAACLFMAACENPADPGPVQPDTGGLAARDIADGGLTLYWDAAPEAEGYQIYWNEGNKDLQGARVIETISADTTYLLGGLDNGAAYYFWVRAVKDGLPLGAFKDPLEVKMPVPAPNAAGITLARDEGSIHILWEPVGGASSYEVWYSLINRVEAAQKWNKPIQGTRVEITELLNHNTYYFWLKSVGAAGPSGFSGVKSETTGEPLMPEVPAIKWTGRLRNSILAIWGSSANATGYEFRYSAGNNPDTAEHVIPELSATAYMAEGLVKGMTYNFWVRSRNTLFHSDWSDMGTVTVGAGLPPEMEGTFFSRYPLSYRSYYMDGYQVGPVMEMRVKFPFNKAKYPNYQGFPGALAEAGMVKEGAVGGEIHDDDQYVFYLFGGPIGVVRAVLERPFELSPNYRFSSYYPVDTFVVIEPFLIPGRTSARYEVIEFRYNVENPMPLLGLNGPTITQTSLDLDVLQALSVKEWDAHVAYPGIREVTFHPEMLPPGTIRRYLAVKLPDLDSIAAYNYFESWNEEKGMYNWEDREQFPAEDLMEYVNW
jgi:hypothetical protein